ncbi:MAG: sodium:proton antiporter [Polaromonas sp.]|nr:sodium:proton antiporter [Polaromonas sp.]
MVSSQILLVVIAALALSILADKRGIQAPLLLAFMGLLASFLPGMERLELAPQTILGIVVPPLLYSAARDFSFFSFMRQIKPILSLGVALVVVTTLAGGLVMAWALPVLTLPAAFILAAVVSPPDAVSAVAMGRQLGLPRRVMTILKGESLINDAAALTIFSIAVAVATQHQPFIQSPLLYFMYAAAMGALIGIVLGKLVHQVRLRIDRAPLGTALSVIVPFAAYAFAEELHASGVLAVIFAGFTLGHHSSGQKFDGRIQEREVWRVVDVLLEAFAFAYMGLQLRSVIADALDPGFDLFTLSWAAALLLVVVISVRLVWVMWTTAVAKARHAARTRLALQRGRRPPDVPLTWQESAVLGWSGMRGVVTVAAAAGVPLYTASGAALDGRDPIAPLAFLVAIGTLLLQGLTLPWLIRWLKVDARGDAEARSAQHAHAHGVMQAASQRALVSPAEHATGHAVKPDAAQRLLEQQRLALIAERDAHRLDDETLREVLEVIDMEQAVLASRASGEGRAS